MVLSPAFFDKGWTNYEVDGIVTRTISGGQILLPFWPDITKQEVIVFSPSLANKIARSTGMHTVGEIAEEIAELLHDKWRPERLSAGETAWRRSSLDLI